MENEYFSTINDLGGWDCEVEGLIEINNRIVVFLAKLLSIREDSSFEDCCKEIKRLKGG